MKFVVFKVLNTINDTVMSCALLPVVSLTGQEIIKHIQMASAVSYIVYKLISLMELTVNGMLLNIFE